MASLVVQKDDLVSALRTVGEGLDTKSRSSLASNVRLRSKEGKLLVMGTSPSACCAVAAPAKGKGKIDMHLGQKALLRLVKAFSGSDVSLQEEGQELVLRSGKRTLRLEAAPGREYELAPVPVGDREDWATSAGKEIGEALQLAATCASPDKDRPVLHTVALRPDKKKLQIAATDSYRLLLQPVKAKVAKGAPPPPALVPLRVAKALAADINRRKPEEVLLERWGEGEAQGVTFTYDDIVWNVALQNGEYPAWEEIMPEAGYEAAIRSAELKAALKGIEAFGSNRRASRSSAIGALRLHLGSDEVSVHYERPGTGALQEDLEGSSWKGKEDFDIGVNPEFLLDAVRVFAGAEILRAWAASEDMPLLFDDDQGKAYLLMPVRLADIGS